MRAFALLFLALGLSACCIQVPTPRPQPLTDQDGGDLGPPLWPDGTIVFGTTDDTGDVFMPIGVEIDLHRGPQGGHHVYAKYQVSGRVAADATFEHRVHRVRDGLLVSRGSRVFDVMATDGGAWISEGSVVMVLCPTAPGVSVMREPLRMEVTVKRAGQFLGRASATSTIRCVDCEADCGG
ncbi:MAG: hypothetical protein Q8L48_18855 [Archangium sp.]|nr:hypothetical protein [Archangium sp.]